MQSANDGLIARSTKLDIEIGNAKAEPTRHALEGATAVQFSPKEVVVVAALL